MEFCSFMIDYWVELKDFQDVAEARNRQSENFKIDSALIILHVKIRPLKSHLNKNTSIIKKIKNLE